MVLPPKEMEVPQDVEYVVLHDLTLEDRNYYLFIRDLEEHKARVEGVRTEGEIMEDARQCGYWSEIEDQIEQKADDHIAYLEGEFRAKAKFKSRQNIIKLQIEDALAKKEYVEGKRNELKRQTAEYLAHEIASCMLLRRVAFKADGSLLIPDDKTFFKYKEEYVIFLFYLIYEMMSEGALDIAEIREIARSTEWRLTWCLSRENLSSIFGRNVGDLTINHKMLIYWSRVYDSALESPEPPDAEIINDDDKFDDWLAGRDLGRKDKIESTHHHQERGYILDGEYIEVCTCGAKEKNKGKGHGERIPHANICLYGTWHQYTAAEKEAKARQIYGRNTSGVRKIIDQEQEAVLQRGVVEEQHLRGQKTRKVLSMPSKVIPVGKR